MYTASKTFIVWFVMVAFGVMSSGTQAAQPQGTVSSRTLLREMTDLRAIAEFPSPSYQTKQFSSYDRHSDKVGGPHWFANHDLGNYLRTEQHHGRTEYVMMDAKGSGAVVRIWSANPSGTLRIYLDGNEEPTLEANMADLLGGRFPGIPEPIAGVRGLGYNLYLPIAYAQSCKITTTAGDIYYIVDYRDYEAGTKVQTFTLGDLQRLKNKIEKVAGQLASPRSGGIEPNKEKTFGRMTLSQGETISLGKFSGPAAICRLTASVHLPIVDAETGKALSKHDGSKLAFARALRGLVLRMTFDGEQTVEVPLGDFFGSAPGINPYKSLPLGMVAHQPYPVMYCHWLMPFKVSASLQVQNIGERSVVLSGQVGTAPYHWTDRSMHFHANYRAAYDVPTRPTIDWNYIATKGKGVYIGSALAIDNPTRGWWGEGDEKIYVDGENFPSWFGTGTEDYYGYAWGSTKLFQHAYHNQTRSRGPWHYGRTSDNRFHVMDRIPFRKSLKFDMELWHSQDVKVNLAVTTYWYARPGATNNIQPLTAEDLVVRSMPARYVAPHVQGAIEGEDMNVIAYTGVIGPQIWPGFSGRLHLWWRPAFSGGKAVGNVLRVEFHVPDAGRYRVLGRFLQAPDYGIVRLSINGQPVKKLVDLYEPNATASKEINLGVFQLKAGGNELRVEMVDANPEAQKKYMFGLDYLRLEPIN